MLFSSYVDDIACTKILMKAALDYHALHRGRGGCVTFSFKAVRRFLSLLTWFYSYVEVFFFQDESGIICDCCC